MILVGLTGSIGMGKSTTAQMFADEGVPVYDADAAVHALYAPGGAAVAPIEAAFPGVTGPQGVDRAKLSHRVVGKPDELKRLESIVHPMLRAHHQKFLDDAEKSGAPILSWIRPTDLIRCGFASAKSSIRLLNCRGGGPDSPSDV